MEYADQEGHLGAAKEHSPKVTSKLSELETKPNRVKKKIRKPLILMRK